MNTAGTYQRTPPPPIWSVRWLAWTALFANQVGVWFVLLFFVDGHWPVELFAMLVSLVGLVVAAGRVHRSNLYAKQLWVLCDNVYGPAADGATVVLHRLPSSVPGVPGEVIVEYPE